MALRIDTPNRLFGWLRDNDVAHVVLRGLRPALDDDIDILVEDRRIPELVQFLNRTRAQGWSWSWGRSGGCKVDIYGTHGGHGTAYHGHPHLPVALAERMLSRRRTLAGGASIAEPTDTALAHCYHLAYHKVEQSGLHWRDPAAASDNPRLEALREALEAAGLTLTLSLRGLHNLLVDAGFGISRQRLTRYVQHDFRNARKSYFHARLLDLGRGEMNLFVIREVARRHHLEHELLERLGQHYELVALSDVDWWTRLRRVGGMRGGKWRRGGKPRVAAVVFDREPIPATPDQQRVHPFVFNARQFIKQNWREWFVAAAGAGVSPKANPIHSTDNEAEALGHLPLFFHARRQREILEQVAVLRGASANVIGRDEDD